MRPKIILISADSDSRSIFELGLEHLCCEVHSTTSGEQGVALATRHRPRAVLAELALPGISGYEVARRLKSDPATAAIPVVAVTSRVMPHEQQRAHRAGFDLFIAKPVTPSELVELIRIWL
jgi:two-component system, cell cycle response regulator DivK